MRESEGIEMIDSATLRSTTETTNGDTNSAISRRSTMVVLLPMCIVAFLMNCKPSEPFLTEILVNSKNVTTVELEQDVWPTFTYSFVVLVLPLGIAADSWSHRGVILVGLLFRLFTRALLYFGRGVAVMQLMQLTFAVATATEGALFSFVYRVVPSELFLFGTSMVYLCYHLGNVLGSLLGQVAVDVSLGSETVNITNAEWSDNMSAINNWLLASSALFTLSATFVFLCAFPRPRFPAPSATLYHIVSARLRKRTFSAASLPELTGSPGTFQGVAADSAQDGPAALSQHPSGEGSLVDQSPCCAPGVASSIGGGVLDVLRDVGRMYRRGGAGLALWTAWNVLAYGAASVWFNYYQLQLFEANPTLRRWGYIEMFNELMQCLGSALPAVAAGWVCARCTMAHVDPRPRSFSISRDARRLVWLSLLCGAALLWSGLVSSAAIRAQADAREEGLGELAAEAAALGSHTVVYAVLLNGLYVMVLGAQVAQSSAAVAWYARADARYPVLFSINTFGAQIFATLVLQVGTALEWSALEFVFATAGLNFVVVAGALACWLAVVCCLSKTFVPQQEQFAQEAAPRDQEVAQS